MTHLALSPAQITALEADTLKLIVVPLDPQPLDGFGDPEIIGDWVMFNLYGKAEAMRLPYTIGQTIPTPHGNRIVTGVDVKRVRDVTENEMVLTGIQPHPEYPPLWKRGKLKGDQNIAQATAFPRLAYRSIIEAQHGPDAWERNDWCSFVSVRKEQNDD